jgi:hypothetical protein
MARYDGAKFVSSFTGTFSTLESVIMTTEGLVAVGTEGVKYRDDTGRWLDGPYVPHGYSACAFPDGGLAVGDGTNTVSLWLDRTDTLASMSTLGTTNDPVLGLYCVDRNRIFAATKGGTLQRYDGAKWTLEYEAPPGAELRRIAGWDEQHLWVVSGEGVTARGADGGWSYVAVAPAGSRLFSVLPDRARQRLWVGGQDGLRDAFVGYLDLDGGSAHSANLTASTATVFGLALAPNGELFAGTTFGGLYHWSEAEGWLSADVASSRDFNDVVVAKTSDGGSALFLVGDVGLVMRFGL